MTVKSWTLERAFSEMPGFWALVLAGIIEQRARGKTEQEEGLAVKFVHEED